MFDNIFAKIFLAPAFWKHLYLPAKLSSRLFQKQKYPPAEKLQQSFVPILFLRGMLGLI
jgi:hypothetical protein